MSHNVHGLLHIVDDYRKFGNLDSCSCFPFENYMKTLKKMVRKHDKPLEQVVKRYNEHVNFGIRPNLILSSSNKIEYKDSHSTGPIIDSCSGTQFKSVLKKGIKFNVKSMSDCFGGFIDQGNLRIFKIFNICICKNTNRYVLLVKLFLKMEPLYKKPINSLKLSIAIVSNLSDDFLCFDIERTDFQKFILLPKINKELVAFPILHTC